jgi:flagellar operon protein (TIGR03826 family)
MADVRNCKKCGKIFSYLAGAPICQECKQVDEEDFKKVKDYLYRNPGSNLTQVSIELEISLEKIRRFLKEGRLEIVDEDGNMFLECEACGKSIKSGRYCSECERNLASGLRETAGKIKSELDSNAVESRKGIAMRYLNKDMDRK